MDNTAPDTWRDTTVEDHDMVRRTSAVQSATRLCMRCGMMHLSSEEHVCEDGRVDTSTSIDTACLRCVRCGGTFPLGGGHICPDGKLSASATFDLGDGLTPYTIRVDEPVPNRCADVLTKALELTSGDRAKTHGDKRQNHQNIADLWNAYLGVAEIVEPHVRVGRGTRLSSPLTAADVATLMCLLKIARMKSGTFNIDNFIDLAGYAGVAAECSDAED